MKKLIIIILVGTGFVCGLIYWINTNRRADDLLVEHVTTFYRMNSAVPHSREALVDFEKQMNLVPIARSFRTVQVIETGKGKIRIASTRGFLFRSQIRHEYLIGGDNTNQADQAKALKLVDPGR